MSDIKEANIDLNVFATGAPIWPTLIILAGQPG